MGLFSFLKRNDAASNAAAPKKSAKSGAKGPQADDVQVLRVRARRRLIGAAVLVAAGVVGFPLIFETQPRPIPVDLPIDIPRKDTAPPLAVPTHEPLSQAEPASTSTPAATPQADKVADKPADPPSVVTEKPVVEKLAEKPIETPAEKPAARPVEKLVEKPVEKPPVKLAEKPADKPADKAKPHANDGARAQALLDGKNSIPASPSSARFIVQVGAYGEDKAAQEVRAKVERLGLKTYAQAVDTAGGRRIRVRLGPFASRDDAERASAKLKGAGLPGAILTL